MASEFAKIETLQLADGEELLEIVHTSLDDLWKVDDWEYPQKRMVHLMDILAHTITRFIQIKCGSLDLWKGPFNQVEEALQTVSPNKRLKVLLFKSKLIFPPIL